MSTKEQILKQAKLLFAQHGYTGVSMRDLAKAAGLGVSGIYHHFPDKKTLYLEMVRQAFANKAQAFSEVWRTDKASAEKLRLFVGRLTALMLADMDFHRLIQRELLDADPQRMRLLAEGVFEEQFAELLLLIKNMVPGKDAHLTAVSIIGLVCHHLQMKPIRCFLPGYKKDQEQPEIIAKHVTDLLLNGLIAN